MSQVELVTYPVFLLCRLLMNCSSTEEMRMFFRAASVFWHSVQILMSAWCCLVSSPIWAAVAPAGMFGWMPGLAGRLNGSLAMVK